MTATLLANGQQLFCDANGNPLANGQVWFYIPGTTTLKATWGDAGQTVPNQNPVVLSAGGTATIYGAGSYRQIVMDAVGNTIWDKDTQDILGLIDTNLLYSGGVSTGGANTQVITTVPTLPNPLALGLTVAFIAGYTNSGPLELNGVPVLDQYGNQLGYGAVTAGASAFMQFDGVVWRYSYFGYSITQSPSIPVIPTGNPINVLSSFNIQAHTATANSYEFLATFGLTSALGNGAGTNDKVALYAGTTGLNGSADIWSLNSVTTISAGSYGAGTYNAQGYEIDFNNFCQDIGSTLGGAGLAAPVGYGLSITGASTFRSSAALLISGSATQWHRGLVFAGNTTVIDQACIQDMTNSTISYEIFGVHTTGVDLHQSSCTQAVLLANGAPISSVNQNAPGAVNWPLITGSAHNMLLGDSNWDAIVTQAKLLPKTTTTYDIGSALLQYNQIYCVGVTQSSNPKLKTDIAPAPELSSVASALPVKTFRWKQGGTDVRREEQEQWVQATELVEWETQESELGPDGVARAVVKRHSYDAPLFDEHPVLGADGQPVLDVIPARPEVLKDGTVVQPAQAEYSVARVHREPRMVLKSVPVKTLAPREGRRLHLGALAPDIRDAFALTGLDIAAFKEEGEFQGYQLDQIVWLTLGALQEQIARGDALAQRLASVEDYLSKLGAPR